MRVYHRYSGLFLAGIFILSQAVGCDRESEPPVEEEEAAQIEAPVGDDEQEEVQDGEREEETIREPPEEIERVRSNVEDMATFIHELVLADGKLEENGCPSILELKDFDEFAGFALLEGAKLLVANHWARASRDQEEQELASDALLPEDFYRRDAEICLHDEVAGRVLVAIATDEILDRREVLKRPPAEESDEFVEDAAVLVKELVAVSRSTARDQSRRGRAATVEGAHVQAAFRHLQEELGWATAFEIPERPPISFYRTNFRSFVERLASPRVSEDQGSAQEQAEKGSIPSSWNQLPVDEDAAGTLIEELSKFTATVTGRRDTMRMDNLIVALDEGRRLPDRRVSPTKVRNALTATFPHQIASNGDLKVHIGPNPGVNTRREHEHRVITVSSQKLRQLAADPLARETLVSVLSESRVLLNPLTLEYSVVQIIRYLGFLLERSSEIARERGDENITRAHVLAVDDWETSLHAPSNPYADADRPATSTRHFIDVSKEAGFPETLDTLDGSGLSARFELQRVIGSGIAVGDVTGNGYPDLYISGEGLNRLYLNRGEEGPGTFVDATEEWGLPEDIHDVRAALFVDFEGDGIQDLLLIRSTHPSQIFRQKDSRFVDVTDQTKLATRRGAHTASVADFDGNGRLDIYIGYYGSERYHQTGNHTNTPTPDGQNGRVNQLWRQDENGHFHEVARDAGVDHSGWTLAAGAIDVNRNGLTDLYVVNDFGQNRLFENQGDGTFEDVSFRSRTLDAGAGMNASFADITANGYWDFYVSNIDLYERVQWFNFGQGSSSLDDASSLLNAFADTTGNRLLGNQEGHDEERIFAGLETTFFPDHRKGWSWGAVFFDFDLNGYEDFYLANGWIKGTETSDQKNQFYRRRGDRFVLQRTDGVEAFAANSRSVVAVDVDRNGRLDLIVNNYLEPPVLLKNNSRTSNRSVQVRLSGPEREPSAIGAIVELEAAGRRQMRQIIAGSSYLGQEDSLLTFGVGSARRADVTVFWPDGTTQTWEGQPTGEVLELRHSSQ